jgi:beta-glucosidase
VYADGEVIKISVDVENTGSYDGEEIVQAYVGCIAPSNVRPDKELKGFGKVFIKSGEKCTVEIEINVSELSYYNRTLQKILDKGEYKICVGTSSVEFLEKRFEIE